MSTKIRPFWKKLFTRIHCPQEFSIPGFSKGFFKNYFFQTLSLFFSDNGHYNCIWIHRRTPNVLELQYGRRPSTVASFELCDYNNFWSKTWTTVASMIFNFVLILAQFWPLSVASFELCDYTTISGQKRGSQLSVWFSILAEFWPSFGSVLAQFWPLSIASFELSVITTISGQKRGLQ